MKLKIKILFVIVFILALLFSSCYLFLVFKGKAIITKQLEGLTQKKVNIGYIGLMPLFNLEIKNLDIEGLLKAKSLFISPSIIGFLSGNIAFNEIRVIEPEFTYQKNPSGAIESSVIKPPIFSKAITSQKKRPFRLILKRIDIKNGKINFIDRTVSDEGIKLTVKDINFHLDNLYAFPRSAITNFELKGKIPWQEEQGQEIGKVEAEGWINLFKKDMQATLKIEDINGIYLYPYYAKWVDLDKARIQKAKLNFLSDIHGLNNIATVHYRLELTDIVFKPRLPGEEEQKAEKIAHAVIGIFKALNQDKIVLEHTFQTRMDRPEFGFGDVKTAFEDKLAQGKKTTGFDVKDILRLPSNLLQGTIKTATELTKSVIDGAVSVGKELKKAVEDTFRKEKEE